MQHVTLNLNNVAIEGDLPDDPARYIEDPSVSGEGHVRVHFRQLAEKLAHYIGHADCVLGCVAWLTHPLILDALANVPHGVSLLVQKEDFLRPDFPDWPESPANKHDWARHLQSQYERLPTGEDRYYWPGVVSELSVCGDPGLQPVRCVGNYNEDQHPSWPRMHHKFLVLCRYIRGQQNSQCESCEEVHPGTRPSIVPYAAWTGSFNCTETASRSLDNAIYTTIPSIVDAYVAEWAQLVAISEPLDWEHAWVEPEWRIGT